MGRVALFFCVCSIILAFASAFALKTPSRVVASATKLNMAVKLVCNDEEPIENTLRRFKRSINQSGHLMAMRNKEMWETAADKKKRKAESARMLNRIERTNDRYERERDGSKEYNS
mmetsp:Transcript_17331/g.16675  ORF Transcript_17331/g.16675 Transcript_17331/m.16675 type:complete len:116 (-) Transcript_17331:224-571(-)